MVAEILWLPVLMFLLAFIFIFVVGVLSFIFWIWMIVDVAKRKFKNETDKVVWILVIVLAGIIGAIIYYFVVKKDGK